MHDSLTGGRRERLLVQVRRTEQARVEASVADTYRKHVLEYFEFCAEHHFDPTFGYKSITAFAQHYVAGSGDAKLRSYKTVYKYLSAWADYAYINNCPNFPFKDTFQRRRINRFITALGKRFPHEPVRDTPLVLNILINVCIYYDIRSPSDLLIVDRSKLVQWARVIAAHDACMRPCEHAKGLRCSDVIDDGLSFITLRVGYRSGERKYKQGPGRRAVLNVRLSHLSAGYVLRVLLGRVHGGKSRGEHDDRVLFPITARSGLIDESASPRPWGGRLGDLQTLRNACERAGVPGARRVTGRSLRAGGTTDYFAAGCTSAWIKLQGGWTSNAYEIYNRPSPAQRGAMAAVYDDSLVQLIASQRR